jgi:histidinol phosphatase-like enzyme
MITNQSCVGKGHITEHDLAQIQQKLQCMLLEEDPHARIDRIYQCTSAKEDEDPRMKPNPGMVFDALYDFSMNATDCCFIGDTSTDLQAAAAAGIGMRVLVATGYGNGLMGGSLEPTEAAICHHEQDAPRISPLAIPFVYCRNLAHAVDWIFAMTNTHTQLASSPSDL